MHFLAELIDACPLPGSTPTTSFTTVLFTQSASQPSYPAKQVRSSTLFFGSSALLFPTHGPLCVTCIGGEQARKDGQPILKSGLPLGLPSSSHLVVRP